MCRIAGDVPELEDNAPVFENLRNRHDFSPSSWFDPEIEVSQSTPFGGSEVFL
jgi:hypothetical protein